MSTKYPSEQATMVWWRWGQCFQTSLRSRGYLGDWAEQKSPSMFYDRWPDFNYQRHTLDLCSLHERNLILMGHYWIGIFHGVDDQLAGKGAEKGTDDARCCPTRICGSTAFAMTTFIESGFAAVAGVLAGSWQIKLVYPMP